MTDRRVLHLAGPGHTAVRRDTGASGTPASQQFTTGTTWRHEVTQE